MKIRDLAPFTIRIPLELKERLKRVASGKLGWSINSEILERLEESFEKRYSLRDFSDGELIDEFVRRWGRDAISIQVTKKEP